MNKKYPEVIIKNGLLDLAEKQSTEIELIMERVKASSICSLSWIKFLKSKLTRTPLLITSLATPKIKFSERNTQGIFT